MFEWSDIRYFLAVAEHGSTFAAGRALRVSQTTVARRLTALEQSLGLILFERLPTGYRLTSSGEALLANARGIAASAAGFADAAGAQARDAIGVVKVTLSDAFATTVLAPVLRDLHIAHPGIRIDLDPTDIVRDLAAGAADVALRVCERPEGAGVIGRRLMNDRWAVYCSEGYAAEHGRPQHRAELAGHAFVGGGEPGIWRIYQQWLRKYGLEDAVAIHHGSSLGLLSAVRAGLGLSALPCLIADHEPGLLRCLPPEREATHGMWLLTHERHRHVPRVRIVLDFLAERLIRLDPERMMPV